MAAPKVKKKASKKAGPRKRARRPVVSLGQRTRSGVRGGRGRR